MIYYIKLDEGLDTLKVGKVKNIHQLNKAIKISWIEINDFMNGTDMPIQWVGNTGMPFPYIKRSGDMYYFSIYEQIIDKRNYKGMSREIISELRSMNEHCTITATSNRRKVMNG